MQLSLPGIRPLPPAVLAAIKALASVEGPLVEGPLAADVAPNITLAGLRYWFSKLLVLTADGSILEKLLHYSFLHYSLL